MSRNLLEIDWDQLVTAARVGSDQAFLTKPGGTRYGAAVMTAGNRIYSAGQYSSFNHITNIHAEMAAVLAAVNANDPVVIALALVCTSAIHHLPSVCGVCRQFLHEHSLRTGTGIMICTAAYAGSPRNIEPLAVCLPGSWQPCTKGKSAPWRPLRPVNGTDEPGFGALVSPRSGELGLLWEPDFLDGKALVKMKYHSSAPDETVAGRYPHSFHQYPDYRRILENRGLGTQLPWGPTVCLLEFDQADGWTPPVPLHHAGLARCGPLLDMLTEAGIPHELVTLTGSWAAGLASPGSDLDLVIQVSPPQIKVLRELIRKAFASGGLMPPDRSATWERMEQWAGGRISELIASGRFAETFALPGSPALKCSLVYVRPGDSGQALPKQGDWELKTITGSVLDDTEAPYKRSSLIVFDESSSSEFQVICWHKTATLLKKNDRVRCTGGLCGSSPVLYMLDPDTDAIELLERAPGT